MRKPVAWAKWSCLHTLGRSSTLQCITVKRAAVKRATRHSRGEKKKKTAFSALPYIQACSGCLTGINNNLTPHKTQRRVCQQSPNINSKAAAELTGISHDSLFNVVHNTFRVSAQCVGAKSAINGDFIFGWVLQQIYKFSQLLIDYDWSRRNQRS